MTAKKEISKTGPAKNDGKVSQIHAGSNAKSKKNAVKYTLWRKKEDIEKIEKLRKELQHRFFALSFNTDSEIYKKLPDLYQNAVKKDVQLQRQVDDLTAKLDELEDLRTSFCRIFELCNITDKPSEPPKALQKTVVKCFNFDSRDDDCEKCDGFNTDCSSYDPEEE